MEITITLPDQVGKWLEEMAEDDFRTIEEMAAVVIRREHKRLMKSSDCACSIVNEAR